jgi:hypothetical protein
MSNTQYRDASGQLVDPHAPAPAAPAKPVEAPPAATEQPQKEGGKK